MKSQEREKGEVKVHADGKMRFQNGVPVKDEEVRLADPDCNP